MEYDNSRCIDVPFHEYITVHPSFIYSSRNFYVHLNYDEVAQFNMKLNERYSDRSLNVPLSLFQIKMKMLCCIYNEVEGNFMRAQIIRQQGMAKYCVLLVDFGKLLTVEGTVIYPLEPRFASVPIFAVSCYLDGHWNKDSKFLENFLQHFFTLITEKEIELKAKFSPPRCGSKYPVSLMARTSDEPWQDVRAFAINKFANLALCDRMKTSLLKFNGAFNFHFVDEINNKFFSFSKFYSNPMMVYTKTNLEAYLNFASVLILKKPHVPLDREFQAVCPYVYTISKFICIIQSFNNSGTCDPEHFTTNLSLFYETFALETENQLNSLIVFRYKEFYFRGFVLKCTSDEFQVLSIDFAFIVNVALRDIFPLVELFTLDKYPMFTCLCSLDNIMPVSKCWSPIAFETFRTWVHYLQKFTIIPRMFLKFTNCIYAVDLKLPNSKESATKTLLKENFGIPMVDRSV